MKTLFYLVTATAVLALAVWAYRQNYETQARLKEVDGLHAEIANLRGRASMLRAEWAYLNNPERLEDLATQNFDRLRLLELGPGNFRRIDQVPYPAAPAVAVSLDGGDE
ncbi:MAG: cell division protein FtsL [Boseongicola sp.]|nr:cell division protein FtsL [Boseongicola sp.]